MPGYSRRRHAAHFPTNVTRDRAGDRRILLTSTGRTLAEPLEAIRRWAEQRIEGVLATRAVGERTQMSTAATGLSRRG